MRIRIKPLDLDSMDSDELKQKAQKIFDTILQLETDKYDYEQRQLDQDYEFKELAERQKLQLRNKAIKKGLDPESFTQKHPPTIHMFSKYERRTDTRTYGDRKKLYEGGAEVIRAEWLESMWKEKFAEFSKRPAKKLPKWFGVRPGKKAGDPETPEVLLFYTSNITSLSRVRRRLQLKRRPRRNTRRKRRKKRRRKRSKRLMTNCKLTQKKTRHKSNVFIT